MDHAAVGTTRVGGSRVPGWDEVQDALVRARKDEGYGGPEAFLRSDDNPLGDVRPSAGVAQRFQRGYPGQLEAESRLQAPAHVLQAGLVFHDVAVPTAGPQRLLPPESRLNLQFYSNEVSVEARPRLREAAAEVEVEVEARAQPAHAQAQPGAGSLTRSCPPAVGPARAWQGIDFLHGSWTGEGPRVHG
jgi:hypothetical protein